MGYPPETHLKPKSREILLDHNFLLGYPIVLKFCTDHGSDTRNSIRNETVDWNDHIKIEIDNCHSRPENFGASYSFPTRYELDGV